MPYFSEQTTVKTSYRDPQPPHQHQLRPEPEISYVAVETPPPPVPPPQDYYPSSGQGVVAYPREDREPREDPRPGTTVTTTTTAVLAPTASFRHQHQGAKKMASSKLYANTSVALRLLALLLVIVAMVLIMTAPGVCFWRNINGVQNSREICPPSNSLFPMNIDRWNSALHFQMRGQNVWGQLALIILSFLFAVPPLIFSCVYFSSGRHLSFSQLIAVGVGILIFLILGTFEVWYATGYDHMQTFIRQIGGGTFSGCTGVPGCEAFYFLCAIIYVLDAVVVFLQKDNTGRRVFLQRSVARTSF